MTTTPANDETTSPNAWKRKLLLTDKGKRMACLANAMLALEGAKGCKGLIAYNELAEKPTLLGRLPSHAGLKGETYPRTWRDQDDVIVAGWLQQKHGIMVGDAMVAKAVAGVAYHHRFHPVREYLEALQWDKLDRLATWLQTHLGVADGAYTRAVGAMWLISAVARILQPGCKADCALILEGHQGAKKSTALATLGGAWFTDQLADMGTKDADEQLRGAWIVELGELSSMSRTEVERVKAFLARRVDRFRVSYGRHVMEYPRQCVFGGTTNASAYLKDETGDRRFWPVKCTKTVDITALEAVRDQLWAEAVVRFKSGERWWIEDEKIMAKARAEQEARFQADAWEMMIGEYLDGRDSVHLDDILGRLLGLEIGKWTQGDQRRAVQCMTRLGWEKARRRTGPKGQREYRYYPKGSKANAPDPDPEGLASKDAGGGSPDQHNQAADPTNPTVPTSIYDDDDDVIIPICEGGGFGGQVGSDPTLPAESGVFPSPVPAETAPRRVTL